MSVTKPQKKPLNVDLSQQGASLQVMPKAPLLTSQISGWKGIQFAHYRQPAWETPEILTPHYIISITLKPPEFVEIVSEGTRQSFDVPPSYWMQVYPPNLSYRVRWSGIGGTEFFHFYVDPQFLAQSAYELFQSNRVELLLHFKESDALVHQIGLAIAAELQRDGVGTVFYLDSLMTALSAHLLHRYTVNSQIAKPRFGGLPKYKLRRAIEYMQDRLSENISLQEIAQEVGMSQYYFCRLFKQSTGRSPYQYLIQQRVEKAKRLLQQNQLSTAEIALAVGFCDQSQLTRHFKRMTGLTPKQIRN
jgi:AraC family transcriptional regulator